MVLLRHLRVAGAEVIAVATGEEVVSHYRALRESGTFPLCIFDLNVEGGMGGIETLNVLRQTWPNTCAVACSGHTEMDMANAYDTFGFAAYLAKPFTRSDLIQILLSSSEQAKW